MSPAQSYSRNLLLQTMSAADYALLQPGMTRVTLELDQNLVEMQTPVLFVYFLETGIVSTVVEADGYTIEVGLVGREGMTGALVLLGADSGTERSFLQIDHATALRIATTDLLAAAARSETLRLLLLRYGRTQMIQVARTAASNAVHALPQRLARWLLMCHDRIEGNELALTHAFMAMMLGVRRSGVTVTLHLLESQHGIEARRGLVLIRDRARLEEIAGAAYGVPEAEYRRLLGPFGKSYVD